MSQPHPQQQQSSASTSSTLNCRWGEVILLDGRSVEILIQPRLFAGDLFDTVASHFDLKEKEYFGLAFLDETGQYNWLNLERRVLEHEYAQNVASSLSTSTKRTSNSSKNLKQSTHYSHNKIPHPPPPPVPHSSSSSNHNQHHNCHQDEGPTTIATSSSIANNQQQQQKLEENYSNNNDNNSRATTTGTTKRLLTKSTSRLPTVSKIRSLKNKQKKSSSKTTAITTSSSMVDNILPRPLARLIQSTTNTLNNNSNSSTSNNSKSKQTNGHNSDVICSLANSKNVDGTSSSTSRSSPPPPPLPLQPPPPLPLVLNTPEQISVMNTVPVVKIKSHKSQLQSQQKQQQQQIVDDPLYDVINENVGTNFCDIQQPMINGSGGGYPDDNSSFSSSSLLMMRPNDVGTTTTTTTATSTLSSSNYLNNNNSGDLEIDLVEDIYVGDLEQQHQEQENEEEEEEVYVDDDDLNVDVDDDGEDVDYDDDVDEDDEDDNQDDDRLVLYFLVKYFVESITMLQDTNTIELFFLQAKSLLINEIVQVDLEASLKLSALILQATYGDCNNFHETKTRNRIHRLQLISSLLLSELTTYQNCEDHILEKYRQLNGITHGESIFRFMTLIVKQPTYGVHFYEVKDKSGTPYWLGLSFKGIDQFSYNDRRLPLKQFAWKQLENLYFREKKFSIEVRDLKRVFHTLSSINLYENAIEDSDTFDDLSTAICDPTTQVSVSRRTFGPCNVTVFVWFASTSSLTKCIWSMAISQHQFYIDRRINKSIKLQRTKEDIVRSLDENYRFSQQLFLLQQQQRNSYSSCGGGAGGFCGVSNQRSSLYSINSLDNSSSTPTSYSSTNSLTHLSSSNHHNHIHNHNHQQPQHQQTKSSSLISLTTHTTVDETNSLMDVAHGNNGNAAMIHGVSRHNSQSLLHPFPNFSSITHHNNTTSSSLSSSALFHRQQPFRHSTSTSSIHKMSSSSSVTSGTITSPAKNSQQLNRKSKMNRLRQLQAQLQHKLDELNHLDLLEQQILSKAASSSSPLNQPHHQSNKDTNDTISTMTIASSLSSSSSSSSSNVLKINGTNGCGNVSAPNQHQHHLQHHQHLNYNQYHPLHPNQPVQFNQTKAPSSLKDFVVTGRRSSSSLSSNVGGLRATPPPPPIIVQNLNNLDISASPQQHHRSKSVGVSSRYTLGIQQKQQQHSPQRQHRLSPLPQQKYTNDFHNQQDPKIQTLPPLPLPTQSSSSSSSSNTITRSMTPTNNHIITNNYIRPTPTTTISQLFHSPYVNKYDTSVQTLLNDNERMNLYSVPNRRTSVALNSLDDTALHQRMSKITASIQKERNNPIGLMMRQDDNQYNNHNQMIPASYAIVTTSVTSSANSLTYSTMSYSQQYRQPSGHDGISLSSRMNGNNNLASNHSSHLSIESDGDNVDSCSFGNNQQNHSNRPAPTPSSPLPPSNNSINHKQYRNIDEENLTNYRSFFLRSNSFSSKHSNQNNSIVANQIESTTKQQQPQKSQTIASTTIVESNYVNLEPRNTPASYFAGIPNNCDYVNVMPRVSAVSLASTTTTTASATIPNGTAEIDGQYLSSSAFNNHIYQNFGGPNRSTTLTTTTSTTSANHHHNLKPPISIGTMANGKVSPRKPPPKIWFETDLDMHCLSALDHHHNHHHFKSIIKSLNNPNNSSNNNLVHNNINNQNQNQLDQHQSRTIYHPIHLVTDDEEEEEKLRQHQQLQQQNQNHKLAPKSPPPPSSTNSYYYHNNNNNNNSRINNNNRSSISCSPTPSQMSSGSSSSLVWHNNNNSNNNSNSNSGGLHYYYQNGNINGGGSGVYSNVSPIMMMRQQSPTTVVSNITTPTGSMISLPTIGSSSTTSSSCSASSVSNKTATNINHNHNTLMRPQAAISPICTVAFVPALNEPSETITSKTMKTAPTIPIASCKGNIVEVDVVTVGHIQPGYEETKPFTMSDFYKYSQRYRQQQQNKNNNKNTTSNKINDDEINGIDPTSTSTLSSSTSSLANRINSMVINDDRDDHLASTTSINHHQRSMPANAASTTSSANDDFNNNNVTTATMAAAYS